MTKFIKKGHRLYTEQELEDIENQEFRHGEQRSDAEHLNEIEWEVN